LIDATTGRHLWSEKYDREIRDLFSVQDDISKEILTALRVKLVEGEQAGVWARGTNNLEAYLKFLKAYDIFKSFNKNSMIVTRKVCQEAIALDPKFEKPHSLVGVSHLIDLSFNWGESPRSSMEESEAALKKAVSLNPLSDYAQATLGHLYLMQERHDEAVMAGEKSLALNPNGDYNMVLLGITFNYVRRFEEAITLFKEAQRRNPYCPAWYIDNGAYSNLGLGRLDEAIAVAKKAIEQEPKDTIAYMVLASACQLAGREEEAREAAKELLRINPTFSLERLAQTTPHKDRAVADRFIEALRKEGLK
jgi:tetratricopeptide (TPR) repeat protein